MGNAIIHDMDYFSIKWLTWGYWLFIVSGIIWIAILIPVQIKQARMAKSFAVTLKIPEEYWRLRNIWNVFGVLATIIPMLNIYWMVFKPL